MLNPLSSLFSLFGIFAGQQRELAEAKDAPTYT
jgi:hypothetical protein